MTERSVWERIGHKVVDMWEWDLEVLAEPWMYYPLLVPAILFMSFVVIKWAIILCPIWIVPRMIFSGYVEHRKKQQNST